MQDLIVLRVDLKEDNEIDLNLAKNRGVTPPFLCKYGDFRVMVCLS